MDEDVEKSWNDPPAFRKAVRYVVIVLILTAVTAALMVVWAAARSQCLNADSMMCDTTGRLLVSLVPAVVLLLGGVGAFVITIREWRAGHTWPIWQGAGWFLLTAMVAYLSVAGTTE